MSIHVIRRGVNRCAIVADDTDRRRLIATWREATAKYDVAIHGFVIMDTHYHVILTPPADGVLSLTMKKIGQDYVRYFNWRHDRIGTLWTGRFRSIPLDDPLRWLTCLRYIELNPVAAKIVTSPDRYRWSSYRFHACGVRVPWLVPHPAHLALGETPAARQAAYRALCVA